MDDLLQSFIDTYYTEEYQQEIYRSLHLYDFYQYAEAFPPLIDIVMTSSSYTSDEVVDKFTLQVNTNLDYILEQHTIVLSEEASIYDKNEILYALGYIQNLEDYTAIIVTLESLESDEEQLATILADLCQLDIIRLLTLIQSFNPSILSDLKTFIYNKEPLETDNKDLTTKIIETFRIFDKVCKIKTIGHILLESNTYIGAKFETYLPYVQDDIKQGDEKTIAANILSVIYLSQDGLNNPLLLYKKHSYGLLEDLNLVSRLEVEIIRIVSEVEQLKGVLNEKNRIS